MPDIDTIIVGAGPYGLSLAAHLKWRGVAFRIFGQPMQFWRDCMPLGMSLKSEGSSSDLFDPNSEFGISTYYREIGRPFVGRVIVPSEIFVNYGLEFQKRFVPDVEQKEVANIARAGDGFAVRLEDGPTLRAARVVVAVGIRDYAHIAQPYSALPKDYVTHSVEYGPVDRLKGKTVIVVGAGASAVDVAWSLHERQVDVSILCRGHAIKFHPEPAARTWFDAIRRPDTPIGGGWKHWFYSNAPHLFQYLPERTRLQIVATALGPSPGWFMTDRVPGRVPIFSGLTVQNAKIVNQKVKLTAKNSSGRDQELVADQIIAATGYRVDVNRLRMLDDNLKKQITTVVGAPILSSVFESSVKGLYFIGSSSAPSFGPVMRFVAGAGFTVRTVSRALPRAGGQINRRPVALAGRG